MFVSMVKLTWRPSGGDTDRATRWNGFDDAGQLRGWVWQITEDRWLATRVGVTSEAVVGRRGTAEQAMALVDERHG
jgi:hypothetical protein